MTHALSVFKSFLFKNSYLSLCLKGENISHKIIGNTCNACKLKSSVFETDIFSFCSEFFLKQIATEYQIVRGEKKIKSVSQRMKHRQIYLYFRMIDCVASFLHLHNSSKRLRKKVYKISHRRLVVFSMTTRFFPFLFKCLLW